LNSAKIHSGIKTLLTALVFLVLQGCSVLKFTPPDSALNEQSVVSIVSAFAAQEKAAKTLFFSGTLTLQNQASENSAQILMIADATAPMACPYGRMKIEITHPWGKPLLHILIEGQRLDILDFTEKRFLRGRLTSRRLSERIPVPLKCCLLWSLARAFPALLKHQDVASFAGNQLTLLDSDGNKVQVFELHAGEPLPYRVSFCKENTLMMFSDFENDGGILYARRMNLSGPDQRIGLTIDISQMTFNTPLPKAVFTMDPPRDFKSVNLRDDSPEH